ncbi:DUF3108 domain-containing protein [Nostoc sp. NIES-2111]
MSIVLRISIAIALLVVASHDATASAIDAAYEARLTGLKVGDVRLRASVTKSEYVVTAEGSYGLPGFRGIFDARSEGRIEDGRPVPFAYSLRTEGGQPSLVSISYADGRYATARIVAAKPSRTDVIAIREEHRIGTLDPLSALLHLVADPLAAAPCSRSAAVFTGQARLDVSPAGPRGQTGPSVAGRIRLRRSGSSARIASRSASLRRDQAATSLRRR